MKEKLELLGEVFVFLLGVTAFALIGIALLPGAWGEIARLFIRK